MYAGLMMFATMVVATLTLTLLGLFFLIALFVWNPEEGNGYNALNPFIHTEMGQAGKWSSVGFGILVLFFASCMGFTTFRSMPEIDKSVGAVTAATECIFNEASADDKCCPPSIACFGSMCSQLLREAFNKAIAILLQLVVCGVGLFYIMSVGYVDKSDISINGVSQDGLQASFKWPSFYLNWFTSWYFDGSAPFLHGVVESCTTDSYCLFKWEYAIGFYLFMCWWLFEMSIARHQFSVSYAICCWYFVETKQSTSKQTTGLQAGKFVQVRQSGADTAPPYRPGVRVQGRGNAEFVVTAAGHRGPGDKDVLGFQPIRVEYDGGKIEVKPMPAGVACQGNKEAMTTHLGSIALGAIIVSMTRPFRLIATGIRALTGGKSENRKMEEHVTAAAAIKGLMLLICSFLEASFGGMGKNAYVGIILGGDVGFMEAGHDAQKFLEDAGGSVAFLHGCCGLYELFGVALITAIGTISSFLFLNNVPVFTDPTSVWFVKDTTNMTFLAALISMVIAYAYMSLFNIAIDTMLFTFSWCRKLKVMVITAGHVSHNPADSVNKKFCPKALKDMLKGELEGEADDMGVLADVRGRHHALKHHQFHHALHTAAHHTMATMRGQAPHEKAPLMSTSPMGMAHH
jgi:hypothetical protein